MLPSPLHAMSEIDANPAPRPPSVYEAEHPGSSLAIWATALILQIGMYPLFFLFDQRGFSDSIRAMVETVLGIIWLLIRSPRGLGLDLRTRRLKTAATTAGSPPSRAQFPCVSSQSPPGDFLRLLLRLQSPATGRRRDSSGFRIIRWFPVPSASSLDDEIHPGSGIEAGHHQVPE